jgi:hypothetical protein
MNLYQMEGSGPVDRVDPAGLDAGWASYGILGPWGQPLKIDAGDTNDANDSGSGYWDPYGAGGYRENPYTQEWMKDYGPFHGIPLTPPSKPELYVCQRNANVPGGDLAGSLGLKHQWIVIVYPDGSEFTAGLGDNRGVPDAGGSPTDLPYLTQTYAVPHNSEPTNDAKPYPDVDGNVARHILDERMGKPQGRWILGENDCNTWVKDVIKEAKEQKQHPTAQPTTQPTR